METQRQSRLHRKQFLILFTSGFILQMLVLSIQSFEKEERGSLKKMVATADPLDKPHYIYDELFTLPL